MSILIIIYNNKSTHFFLIVDYSIGCAIMYRSLTWREYDIYHGNFKSEFNQ